eukprot:8824389-Pyramimonas_sp.AAC.1
MPRSWGCVHPSVLEWAREKATTSPRNVPSLAFVHIPPAEFVPMWNAGDNANNGTNGVAKGTRGERT